MSPKCKVLFCLLVHIFTASASGGLIQIDFAADVDLVGTGETSSVIGQIVLDTSMPFPIGEGGVDGPIVGGFVEYDGFSRLVDPTSAFSFVGGGLRPDYGLVGIVASLGGFDWFTLELTATDWTQIDSGWDVLVPSLNLDDLISFDPVSETTRFGIFLDFELTFGPLTSLSISEVSAVSEPTALWLLLIGLLSASLFGPWNRSLV